MRKFKSSKAILSMALAFSMCVAPLTAGAATNNQSSVDPNGNPGYGVETVYTLNRKNSEITIGLGGKYDLKPSLSATAKEYGFVLVKNADGTINPNKVALHTSTINGIDYYTEIPVTWTATKPTYATVNSNGTITAKKVCLTKTNGSYYTAPVTASIPNVVYTNAAGEKVRFADGVFYKNLVTVVPERDLSVYYLGVWVEDLADDDAQHYADFDIDSDNVKSTLKDMAQYVTKHCYSTNFKVLAFTKTNDSLVRAYIKTTDVNAGNHYYVMTFDNNDGANKITVSSRDYCDSSYKVTGTYYRQ